MFRDAREFHGVVLRASNVSKAMDAVALLPTANVERMRGKEVEEWRGSECEHVYWYSRRLFAAGDADRRCIERRRGGYVEYRYNLHVVGMQLDAGAACCIAAPFAGLEREICTGLARRGKGRRVRYVRIRVGDLVDRVRDGHHRSGAVRLSRLQMLVEGDSPTKMVELAGSDVVHSKTYRGIVRSLRDVGVSVKRCRIVFEDDDGKMMWLQMDCFGNYAFRVKRRGVNLPILPKIFHYLEEQGVMNMGTAVPVDRQVTEK